MLNALLANEGYNAYIITSVILFVCLFVAALVSIILVLCQQSNSDGIQGITGSSETFFGKNKGRTTEAKLRKLTVIFGSVFSVLTLVSSLLLLFFNK